MIDRINPPASGTKAVWDKRLPGFGLRISATGRKTWIAVYRVSKTSRVIWETLGNTYRMELDEAKALAKPILEMASKGKDPAEERRKADEARQAALAAEAEAARQAVEDRFEKVAERWVEHGWQRSRSKRRWSEGYQYEVKRILKHDVFPHWGTLPIKSITRADVVALLEAKASRRERPRKGMKNGAGVQANRILTRLRTLFAWAQAEGIVGVDPTAGVAIQGEENERDRCLDDSEIVWFWRGCERVGSPYGSIFRLLLLTAQREDEIAALRWSEIDLDQCTWTIPRERTKSNRAHVVHLSELSCEIMRGQPRKGTHVFPGQISGNVITSFSRAKERVDAAMVAQKCEVTPMQRSSIGCCTIYAGLRRRSWLRS
jgi:integrase